MSAGREGPVAYSPRTTTRTGSDSAWGYYLAALFLAALGLIFLNDYRYALAAQQRWVPASGRVTENKVVVHRGRRSSSYNTFISYTYNTDTGVHGAGPLELNKFKLYFTEGGAWDDLRGRFPEGKSLEVYYNPSNPSESSLGLAGAPGVAVPIVFFLFAFGAVYVGRNQ